MIGPIIGNGGGGGKKRKRRNTRDTEDQTKNNHKIKDKKKVVKYLLEEPIPPKVLKILKKIFYSPLKDGTKRKSPDLSFND